MTQITHNAPALCSPSPPSPSPPPPSPLSSPVCPSPASSSSRRSVRRICATSAGNRAQNCEFRKLNGNDAAAKCCRSAAVASHEPYVGVVSSMKLSSPVSMVATDQAGFHVSGWKSAKGISIQIDFIVQDTSNIGLFNRNNTIHSYILKRQRQPSANSSTLLSTFTFSNCMAFQSNQTHTQQNLLD